MPKDDKLPEPHLMISQIGHLNIVIRKAGDKLFREEDFPLEMDQIPVLMMVYYRRGASQQEICSALRRDKASINRTVAFLVKKHMAKVLDDATDKRKKRVQLTVTGNQLARRANIVIEKFGAFLASTLTEAENKQFHAIMAKLIETVSAA
jgi:DNA-binding MarR family transcriptional regulator